MEFLICIMQKSDEVVSRDKTLAGKSPLTVRFNMLVTPREVEVAGVQEEK
ncbi:MAG: hypothetical protein O7G86_20710 [Gammaproteobacteria bacterium]|nr:hypothetical protein [Gammaproteobacteria bacterium]